MDTLGMVLMRGVSGSVFIAILLTDGPLGVLLDTHQVIRDGVI